MQTYYATVRDTQGDALTGATVTVYMADGVTVAPSIYDRNGAAQPNPLQSDSAGEFAVAAPDGTYVISVQTPGNVENRTIVLLDSTALVTALPIAVASAQANATLAQNAANAALASGQLYLNTAAGIAGTTSTTNKYFLVISTDGSGAWYLWQNVSGTATAVLDVNGQQVGIPAQQAIATIHSVLDPLNAAATPGDDAFWHTAFSDLAGNVFGGFGLNGQFLAILAMISNLNVSNLNVSNLIGGSNVVGSGTPANIINIGPDIQIYSFDTNWDWVFVDGANNPIFGSYNGAFQYLGGGVGAGITDGGSWAPNAAVTVSQIRALPDGRHGIRGPGTPTMTRTVYDATETATWITLGEKRKFTRMFGKQSLLPGPIVGSRSGNMAFLQTDAGMSTRIATYFNIGAGNIQLGYPAWCQAEDTETSGPILVSANIEYPAGTFFQAHFIGENSQAQVTISPGMTVFSLPIGIDIPKNAIAWVNTTVIPSSGGNYPYGKNLVDGQTDGAIANSSVNYSFGGTCGTAGTFGTGYGPLAVCGIPSNGNPDIPVVAALGDSISAGVGANTVAQLVAGKDGGVIEEACLAAGISYINLGNNGYNAATMGGAMVNRRHIVETMTGCTDVVIILGTNDLNGATSSTAGATLLANLSTIWNSLADRGIKVWQATIPPRTNSTDSWATANNQSPVNSNFGPEISGGSQRQIVNTAIRAIPSPLSGIVDIAAAVETLNASNSYVWIPNSTNDGVHPYESTGIYSTLLPLIPVAFFG